MMQIAVNLDRWYRENMRNLPWRETSDPYKIWISEVILQQTRVAQGTGYYNRFVEVFPDVKTLAHASEEEVLNLWKGLGYYSRARNLHRTAKIIVSDFNGIFPGSAQELINLPGIGSYTANAIASISFNEPVAVVDGNVIRVITRLFGIIESVDNPKVIKKITEIANDILNKSDPGTHNQAVMEFGALFCTPRNPQCDCCPLANKCKAYELNQTNFIPYKEQKEKKKPRYLYYLDISDNNGTYLQRRANEDIWKGLYEIPMLMDCESESDDLVYTRLKSIFGNSFREKLIETRVKHILSHRKLYITVFRIEEMVPETIISEDAKFVSWADFKRIPLPVVFSRYFEKTYPNLFCK